MRIGLLGLDDPSCRLAEAAVRAGHTLVARLEDSGTVSKVSPAVLAAPPVVSAEELLSTRQLDAVIVAACPNGGPGAEARMAALKAIAQEGIPALVSLPAASSSIDCYELEMACQESAGLLFPFSPWRFCPAVGRLRELIGDDRPLGALKQVSMEVGVADDARETLTRRFVQDLDLLRPLIGEIRRLGSMTTIIPTGDILDASRSPAASPNWPNLGVQLVGSTGAAGRWNTRQGGAHGSCEAHIACENGAATLTVDADGGKQLAWTRGEESQTEMFEETEKTHAAEHTAVVAFEQAIRNEDSRELWSDACHAMLAAEAIPRSLKRGRIVDLRYDENTEEGTFKGVMAAGGCLVLLIALMILCIGLLFGELGFKRFDTAIPYIILGLILLFMTLQSFAMVFRGSRREKNADAAAESPEPPANA